MGRSGAAKRAGLIAAVVAALAAPQAHAQCKILAEAEIPVVVERGRILIPSEINGQKAYFILDTGAARSLLFFDAAERFKVASHNVSTTQVGQVYGIGGDVGPRWGEIASLKLGSLSMPNAGMLIGGRDFDTPEIAGIIGYDVFARHDLEFDLAHNMVRLLHTPGCSDDQMDYWRAPYAVAPLRPHGSEDGQSYVDVQLNGVRIEAMLDTGSPRSTVTLVGAARAGVRPGSPGVVEIGRIGGVGAGGTTPVWSARFKSFSIGEEQIANPTLTMADMFGHTLGITTGTAVATQYDMPGMLVGFDFFLAHRAIISRDHQKLYFSYNGGPIFAPPQAPRTQAAPARPATP